MCAVPFDDIEVAVKQENDIVLHFFFIQCDGCRLIVLKWVFQQRRLYHGDTVQDILSVDNISDIVAFIEWYTEPVDEMWASEVVD